jgi:hypothetical protein
MLILAQAIEKAGTLDADKVAEVLYAMNGNRRCL